MIQQGINPRVITRVQIGMIFQNQPTLVECRVLIPKIECTVRTI